MTTRHKVFARTVEGEWISHPSLAFTDWRRAVAAQRILEDARIAGRLPLINAIVVRSEADPDPRYAHARDDLAPFFVGRHRGTARLEDAVKHAARGRFYGEEGGWIFREPVPNSHRVGTRRPVCQGWRKLALREGYLTFGNIVGATVPAPQPRYEGQMTRRYYVNDLLDIDADSVLGPQHETVEA